MITPSDVPGKAADWADERFSLAGGMRKSLLNKVFPDHWSFLLGEIALYSFIVLLLTGTYLAFFFVPSLHEVVYHGSYTPLRGVEMSEAYQSTLNISFDVRGGLVLRQIHHWAALVFVAAMVVHMMRIFFTGAFRKPREVNWLIGIGLLTMGLAEGFFGYSLPDDLLSGTGLRIFNSVLLSIPVVGTWASYLLFNGEYPGEIVDERFYILHVLLIPGIILGLISAHLAILVRQKHTQFPGPGRTENNVVGIRMFPLFALQSSGFFMIVFATLALLGGVAQINPIWLYGPYDASVVTAGAQPDWYIGFLEGSLRLFPSWEIRGFGYTLSAVFWPAVFLPGLMFTAAAVYPFLESLLQKDKGFHNLLQRPRDAPTRTALGAMALTFYLVLVISGGNDIIAKTFSISLNAMTWGGRIALLILPPIAFWTAQRICLGLQQHDREVLAHGVETGIIRRLPSGEFTEIHQPLGEVDEHGHPIPLEYREEPVPKKMNKLGYAGRTVKGFFTPVKEAETLRDEQEHGQLTGAGSGQPHPPQQS